MTIKHSLSCGMRSRFHRPAALCAAITLGLSAWSTESRAYEYSNGDFNMQINNTLTYGIGVRVASRDEENVGKVANNPGVGLLPNALQREVPGRWSSNGDDGNLNYDRGDLFSNQVKLTSELNFSYNNFGGFLRVTGFYDFENATRDDLSSEAKDAVGRDVRLLDAFVFYNFDNGASLRLGRQVVSWGESTFIQGGIGIINPVDVSALRGAGAELKEAFIPLNMIYGSFDLTQDVSVEAFYLFEFSEIEPDPRGTYFSTNDFATAGARYVMLGFGTTPDPADFDACFEGPTALTPQCQSAVPRGRDRYASHSGQGGVALRWFAPQLYDSEFGFYAINYHSRLPLLSGVAITNTRPSSGRYFVEYPEDIQLYGISFNTNIPGGVALQGELSYRPNMPLQFDDVELLFAALTPLNALIPAPGLRFGSQLGTYGVGEEIRGWERHEVSQLQFTATKLFGPGNFLNANQIAVVGEIGGTKVWDLPSRDLLRYEGDGTNTGGGPDVNTGALRNPVTQIGGYPTQFSWGYRLAARADYNNAFGSPFTLSPRVAFNHDVNGTTPGPGGNFIQGRKSITAGIEAVYLNDWAFDLAYTNFYGAGVFNNIADRDFVTLSVKYSF